MDELLPAAFLVGMANPRAWVKQVEQQLTQRVPNRAIHWRRLRNGLLYLSWQELASTGETLTIWLCAHPTRVYLSIWASPWDHNLAIGYWPYHALVITVATLIIDQYAAQDGPPIRLQIQPYAETQAPLNDDDGGQIL